LPLAVLALVLLAASLNVGWNAVARSIAGKATFAWFTALIGVAGMAPLFVWQRLHDPGPIDPRMQRFVVVSALIEAAYFLLLQASYRRADLSLVYPLSRGASPLFAVVPARIWTGEALAAREYLGIAVILVGAIVLAQSHPRNGDANAGSRAHGTRASAIALVLLTSVAIAAYQVVDGIALRGTPPPRPLEYLFLMQVGLTTLLTVEFVHARVRALARAPSDSGERPAGAALLRQLARESLAAARPDWRRLVVAGVAIQASYLLILCALREAKIPLVIAARSGGIPISLIVGRFALKERIGVRRVVAALVIVAGVLLLVDWRS
jgi:uncharacterized membrane protein